MVKHISPNRKGLSIVGFVVMTIGGCLLMLPFVAIAVTMTHGDYGRQPDHIAMLTVIFGVGFVGLALIGVGSGLRGIADRGLVGSKVALGPQKVRSGPEPWTYLDAETISDGLEDGDFDLNRPIAGTGQTIPVKCRECGKLNAEDSKFCRECGESVGF